MRSSEREIGAFLDLVTRFGEEDHAVLDELVARLSAIEHRLLLDGDRLRFAALVATLFGPASPRMAGTPSPQSRTWFASAGRRRFAPRPRRAERGRRPRGDGAPRPLDRRRPRRARAEPARAGGGDGGAQRGRGAVRVVPGALREGDRSRLPPPLPARARVVRGSGPRSAGIELAFGDEVPLQDVASFVGALLANAPRAPFWARLRADWDRLHAR